MLAYAAHRRQPRKLSPAALLLIVGGHALAIGLLITARMEVGVFEPDKPLVVRPIPLPEDPPPLPPEPSPEPRQAEPAPTSHATQPPPIVDRAAPGPTLDLGPPTLAVVPDIGPALETPLTPPPPTLDPPRAEPVRLAARFATPADQVRPPYPEGKRRLEEEATLRLRLSIDERGRVTAVAPAGRADPEFLEAARRHLTRYWRYKPALENGRPVASTLLITLHFRLEDG